jgi:biopolymer transport protein ExbD
MHATRTTALASDINVTPLVDVCLVLLIIFMVVLPAVVNGVPVTLPETAGAADPAGALLAVTIKADGTVYLGTDIVRRDEVPSALQRLRRTASERPIGVRADKTVPYGEVVTVLDACRQAGWEDVTLIAARPAGTS